MAVVETVPGRQPVADINEKDAIQDNAIESDSASDHKQQGVKNAEAVTIAWDRKMLILTFVLLYLIEFIDAIMQSVQQNLTPYVTSAFGKHALLSTTSIVATIMGGTSKLAICKIIDIWGRVEGLGLMMLLTVIGMIMKATCKNVETYSAAHCLYWIGHLGISYVINVVVSDITSLKNRMIIFGINSTPTIASVFAGPAIAQLFLDRVNFRWAFGAFSIILVVFYIPVLVIFYIAERKAKTMGVVTREKVARSPVQTVVHYFFEFDFVGMILTIAGFALILLPFSLASYAPHGWKSGYIIAMIVLGVACLGAMAVWERWFSPVPYFPWKFLKDRTILGTCLLYCFMFLSIYCWDAYYSSYLQVVHRQSVTLSGYVMNSFSLASAIIGPFVGLALRYTNRYTWMGYAGFPFVAIGTGLLIHFRHPGTGDGFLVMCQVFNGIGTGIWANTAPVGLMASVTHQETAVALALWGMFGSIGAAVGFAVAGAIWTNVLPPRLLSELPADQKDVFKKIYGDIEVQMSYADGTAVRKAIVDAYAAVQRYMVIAGAAFLPLMLICLIMWRNIDLAKRQAERGQTKGNVW